MMAQQQSQQETFQQMLESFYGAAVEGDPLQKIKSRAWEHFLNLGLPTREVDFYKYIKLKTLYSNSFVPSTPSTISPAIVQAHIFSGCEKSVLVFVNGEYNPDLSNTSALPSNVAVMPLSRAMRTYGTFLNNHWAKAVAEEKDPFAALNMALARDGLFLYVPPKTVIETPIQVLHLVDAQDKKMLLLPRLQAFIGTQSQVDIYNTQVHLSGSGYFINQSADFAVEESAHIRFTQVTMDLPDDVWCFDAVRAWCKANSTIKTVGVTNGSLTVRNDYRMAILGDNAEVELDGVWMLSRSCEAHAHVLVDHQAPNCRSRQLFKGVLRDGSRSSFEGKILVRQAAQKTDAFQLNNNLLMSPDAHADSKPNLEIFADDVKASHGATVGRLDEEQLFYMKSRGFSSIEAKNILIYGFCKEVIERVGLPALREQLERRAEKYLS
jgi:Fe-S cluster assembly protein SufD